MISPENDRSGNNYSWCLFIDWSLYSLIFHKNCNKEKVNSVN